MPVQRLGARSVAKWTSGGSDGGADDGIRQTDRAEEVNTRDACWERKHDVGGGGGGVTPSPAGEGKCGGVLMSRSSPGAVLRRKEQSKSEKVWTICTVFTRSNMARSP